MFNKILMKKIEIMADLCCYGNLGGVVYVALVIICTVIYKNMDIP